MYATSQGKNNGSAECCNTQLSLFDSSVIVARQPSSAEALCHVTLAEIKRQAMQTRQIRGLEIASQSHRPITYNGAFWVVPSQSSSKTYAVTVDPPFCTCLDFRQNAMECKHVFAVKFYVAREGGAVLPEVPERKRKTYKQNWPAYRQAQTNEKAKFLELLFALCEGVEESPQRTGRPRIPLADRIFSVAYKVYSTLSARRFTSDLREARQRGYTSTVPTYVSVSRFLESEELTPVLRQLITESALPLKAVEQDFAVDSSGFSTCNYVRWYGMKYGGTEDWHDWIKLHAMVGVTTHIITSVELSGRHAHDSQYFEPLVTDTARNFTLREVSADKAYSHRAHLRLVEKHGGTPYIAFRSNARGDSKCATWNRLFHYYSYHREEYMTHYHKRSNVESTFSMIKSRFGERLRSRTQAAQVNEVLCKVLCHNLCVLVQSMYELGVEVSFETESPGVT
jgi:transposase